MGTLRDRPSEFAFRECSASSWSVCARRALPSFAPPCASAPGALRTACSGGSPGEQRRLCNEDSRPEGNGLECGGKAQRRHRFLFASPRPKAAWHSVSRRSPRRCRVRLSAPKHRQVLECAGPPALFARVRLGIAALCWSPCRLSRHPKPSTPPVNPRGWPR